MNPLISDMLVAGGPGDFMQARHLVLRGPQRDVGCTLARIAVAELGVDKRSPWSEPRATAEQLAWLRDHWPAHYARSQGVREALELAPDDHAIDPTFLYYYWAIPGCSNVFWPPSVTATGHAVLTRNYDFTTGTIFELMGQPIPPEAKNATSAPFILETHAEAGEGYSTLCMSSYDLLGGATDGVNSEGLGVALMSTSDVLRSPHNSATFRNGVGIDEIQLARFLLENAATAAQARELLARTPQYTMWVPCHFVIGDRTGDAFVYSRDVSPDAPVIRSIESSQPLCSTNHIPGHIVADVPGVEESKARLARLQAMAEATVAKGDVVMTDMLRTVRSVAATTPAGEGRHASRSVARTLWHAAYDLEERSLGIDFYLGEDPDGGIRRSGELGFRR